MIFNSYVANYHLNYLIRKPYSPTFLKMTSKLIMETYTKCFVI